MKWETVIGLETHAQLSTSSKIFSGASTAFGAAPNTQACAVDIALPGVLPVLNRGAVEHAIRFGLAVGAKINRRSIFARKNYFYPDLPKGYQISQYELPIVEGGAINIVVDGKEKTVPLTRAHLEEDAGKSIHGEALSAVPGYAMPGLAIPGMGVVNSDLDLRRVSGIDLNRAGTPLLEIVSEPDMHSAEEAVAYAKVLHGLVRWIGICDGNMQEGSFRCDANVSVRRPGEPLGTRCEIKNLNSFRFMEQAIRFEVRRQIELIEDGGKVVQETRLYDPDKDETRSMRSKEDAMDYRYFPDPDLLPLDISSAMIDQVRATLPELPDAKRVRYTVEYSLSAYDANGLTASREMADYFEACIAAVGKDNAKLSANWLMGEVSARLNKESLDITACPIPADSLAKLIDLIARGTITNKIAKETVFPRMWEFGKQNVPGTFTLSGPGNPGMIVMDLGLQQVSDTGEIGKVVDQVLAANAQQVDAYKAGKAKAFNSLVGQVMKATQGKANPAQVNALLKQKLGGS